MVPAASVDSDHSSGRSRQSLSSKNWRDVLAGVQQDPVLVISGAAGQSASRVNGVYELRSASSPLAPPCFQHQTFSDVWLYVAADNRWWVSTEENKESRIGTGWAYSQTVNNSFPRTVGVWGVVRDHGRWEKQALKVVVVSQQSVRQATRTKWAACGAELDDKPVLVISKAGGAKADTVNGTYELKRSGKAGEPPRFKNLNAEDAWLYLAKDKRWWVSSKKRMEQLSPNGWAYSDPVDAGVLPTFCAGWMVTMGSGRFEAQGLHVMPLTEKQAENIRRTAWKVSLQPYGGAAVMVISGARGSGAAINGIYDAIASSGDEEPPSFRHRHLRQMLLNFHKKDRRWWISDSVGSSAARGWAHSEVVELGMLPTQVGEWRVSQGSNIWQLQDDVRVVAYSKDQYDRKELGAWQQALTETREHSDVVIISGATGPKAWVINGQYFFDKGTEDGKPPSFQKMGDRDSWLYYSSAGMWVLSTEDNRQTRASKGWARSAIVAAGVLPTSTRCGGWEVSDESGAWVEQDLELHAKSQEEVGTRAAGAWRKAYSATRKTLLELSGAAGAIASINGTYELQPSYKEKGTMVYRHLERDDIYLYPAKDSRWWVSSVTNKDQGEAGGWACSDPVEAGTVPKLAAVWYAPGEDTEKWQTQELKFEERAKEVDIVESWKKAVRSIKNTPFIKITGARGERAEFVNGIYELDENSINLSGDPPAFRAQGENERWLFYARDQCWWIGSARRMLDSEPKGWARSKKHNHGFLPTSGSEWKAIVSDDGRWVPQDIQIMHISGEQMDVEEKCLKLIAPRPVPQETTLEPPTPMYNPITTISFAALQAEPDGIHMEASATEVPRCPRDSSLEMVFVLDGEPGALDSARVCFRSGEAGPLGPHWTCPENDVHISAKCLAPPEEAEYLVDNSQLNATTNGMSHRTQRSMDSRHPECTALWGTTVRGRVMGRGWLLTSSGGWLPTHVDGHRVLVRQASELTQKVPLEEATIKEQAELDPAVMAREPTDQGEDAPEKEEAELGEVAVAEDVAETSLTGSTHATAKADDAPKAAAEIRRMVQTGAWKISEPKDPAAAWVNTEADFIADNSVLKAPGRGIRHRVSRTFDDYHPKVGTKWGKVVRGVDLGDGWLQVSGTGLYVPTDLNGVRIMVHAGAHLQDTN